MHFIFMNTHVFFVGKKIKKMSCKALTMSSSDLGLCLTPPCRPFIRVKLTPHAWHQKLPLMGLNIPVLKLLILIHALLWNMPIHNIHILVPEMSPTLLMNKLEQVQVQFLNEKVSVLGSLLQKIKINFDSSFAFGCKTQTQFGPVFYNMDQNQQLSPQVNLWIFPVLKNSQSWFQIVSVGKFENQIPVSNSIQKIRPSLQNRTRTDSSNLPNQVPTWHWLKPQGMHIFRPYKPREGNSTLDECLMGIPSECWIGPPNSTRVELQ